MTTSYKLEAIKELKAEKKAERIKEAEELKAAQEAEEKVLDSQIQQQRIDVQKQIADDKLEVAVNRLKQNADLKLLELENKLRGMT